MKARIIYLILLSSLFLFSCSIEKENNDLRICVDLALESMRANTHRIFINNRQDHFENIIALHDSLRTNLDVLNIEGAKEELNTFVQSKKWGKRIRFKEEELNEIDEKIKMLFSNDLSEIAKINSIRETYNSFVQNINFGCGIPGINVELVYGDTLYLNSNEKYKIPYRTFSNQFSNNCFGYIDNNDSLSFETPNYTDEIISKRITARMKNKLTGEIFSVKKTYYVKLKK